MKTLQDSESADPMSDGEGNPPRSATVLESTGTPAREWAGIAISGAIVIVTLWMLLDTYWTSKLTDDPKLIDAFGRQKDVLLLGLGFLGTVTGYYFGRLPAERQAEASRREAETANDAADAAAKRVENAREIVADAIREIDENGTDPAAGGNAAKGVRDKLLKAENQLRRV